MTDPPTLSADPSGDRCWYRIRVAGRLPAAWAADFGGLAPIVERSGGVVTTRLEGPLCDQAELHGVLARIRDLGLELLLVERVEAPPAPE